MLAQPSGCSRDKNAPTLESVHSVTSVPLCYPTLRVVVSSEEDEWHWRRGTFNPPPGRMSCLGFRSKGVVVMMWWNTGHWYWGIAMMILFWGATVALAFVVLRGRASEGRPNARDLLDERFAKGDVSEEEYEHKRSVLEGRSAAAGRG